MSSFNQRGCIGCRGPLDGLLCRRCTCEWCGNNLRNEFCSIYDSGAGNSFVYDPNLNSFNDPPNFFNHPPQPWYESYSCELCGNDSHYGFDCPPRGTASITPVLPTIEPEDSLIMGDENLSTIPEKKFDKFIKSSVEDLVPIPSEFEDTTDNDKFDDEYISSDVNPLFNKVLEDIESEDSYVSKLDESDLLVTPLSKLNEDECFDPGGDFILEEIKACLTSHSIPPGIDDDDFDPERYVLLLEKLLNDDPSSLLPPKELNFEELKDTIPNLPLEMFLDHDPRSLEDEPDKDDLKNIVKVFDPVIHKKIISPTNVRFTFEDRHYFSLTFVIRIFLPYLTYSMDYSSHLSSGSEDIIPDISASSFYSLESVAYESPMMIFSFFYFCPKDKGIRGEIAPDFEDSRARGFVLRSLDLRSFACLYMGIQYPRSY
ncbi:hypothetical protein Tco_0549170 [Tanacetum coccineum]